MESKFVKIILLLFFALFSADANSQPIRFNKAYSIKPSIYSLSVRPTIILKQTNDKGYIITGQIEDSMKLFLIKTDSIGKSIWSKSYDQAIDVRSIKQTFDKGYIITGLDQDTTFTMFYLLKTDSNGIVQWRQKFYADQNSGFGVLQCIDSGFIVTGALSSGGHSLLTLIKTNAIGIIQWYYTYGEYTAGKFYYGNSVIQTSNGSFIVSGYYFDWTTNRKSALILKTDSIGNQIWLKSISDGINDCFAKKLYQTDDGGFIFLATNPGGGSSLIKTDTAGIVTWSKSYNESISDFAKSSNAFVLVGNSTVVGAFLLKTDTLGSSVFGKHYYARSLDIFEPNSLLLGYLIPSSIIITYDGGFAVATNVYALHSYVGILKTDLNGSSTCNSESNISISSQPISFSTTSLVSYANITTVNQVTSIIVASIQNIAEDVCCTFPISMTSTNPHCTNDSTGAASILISGGLSPFAISWSQPPDTTIIQSNQTAINLTEGIIQAKVTDNIGCTSSLEDTIVDPPLMIVQRGSDKVNCGTGVQIGGSPTASGGVGNFIYSWTPTNGLNSSVLSNPFVTDTVFHSYYVTVTDQQGCSHTDGPIIVSFLPADKPIVMANGATTFCQGDSVLLNSTSATSYLWSNGSTTQNIQVNTSGYYSLMITDSNGCHGDSDTSIVSVNPNPPTPIIQQVSTFLASSSPNGNQWYLDSINLPSDTNQFYTPQTTGYYSVIVTDTNGCSSTSTQFYFTQVGINSPGENNSFLIFPNPSTGSIAIVFSNHGDRNVKIQIVNIIGEIIYQSNEGSQNIYRKIDLSDEPSGSYLINVITENSVLKQKLIIE